LVDIVFILGDSCLFISNVVFKLGYGPAYIILLLKL
jgi:hypothetical protein